MARSICSWISCLLKWCLPPLKLLTVASLNSNLSSWKIEKTLPLKAVPEGGSWIESGFSKALWEASTLSLWLLMVVFRHLCPEVIQHIWLLVFVKGLEGVGFSVAAGQMDVQCWALVLEAINKRQLLQLLSLVCCFSRCALLYCGTWGCVRVP